jgi:hypothetical protein
VLSALVRKDAVKWVERESGEQRDPPGRGGSIQSKDFLRIKSSMSCLCGYYESSWSL